MRFSRSAGRTAFALAVASVAFFGLASHAQMQQLGPAATTVVNDAGDLAFISAGGAVVVLQRAGGDAVAVLRSGDAVPGHDGSRVVRIDSLKLNAPGLVAFTAEFWAADGTLKSAILSFDGTTLRTIVDSDDLAAAAGVAGGPTGLPLTLLGLDDAGGIVVEGPARFVVSSAGAIYQLPAPSAAPAVPAPRPALPVPNVIQNGDFTQGTDNLDFWQIHATPTQSYIHVDASTEVLNFYRDAFPPDNANQATVFQQTGVGFPLGARLEAQFRLGNSSTVRKRLKVLIVDSDFSDITACSFELDAGAPLATYAMFTHTSKAWTNAAIYFYAGNVGSDSGAYQIDDVQLGASGTASTARTDCVDPTAPGPTAGVDGSNLIENGDFSAFHAQWGTDGPIETDASTTVMQFRRLATTPPPAVVLHTTNEPIADNAIVTATFQLGNSSLSVPQRVVVLIHEGDFSDILTCTFNLPANQALKPYVIRSFTTKAWTNATFSLYPRDGNAQWILADNITLQTTPSADIVGTECIEPNGLAPVVTSGANLTYTEGDPATVIDPLLTVTDADSPTLASATITISANYQAGADVLAFAAGGGMGDIAFTSYVGGVLTLTSAAGATPAEWQAALRAVTYENTSQDPSTLARTISWQVSDGGTFSNIATSTITVIAVNDAPVNTIPADTSTDANTDLTGLVFSVADVDAGTAEIEGTITVTNGTVTLNGVAGLTLITGDGTADATFQATGTLAEWNTALNGVTFHPTPSYFGPASIQMLMNDQGATGTGGPQQDTDTLDITVNAPPNNPPVATTDAYSTIGNTELRVGLAAGTTPNVATTGSVLTNDTDPDTPLSVTGIVGCGDVAAPFDCPTTGGGTVSMNSDGTFSYVPEAGDTSDNFQYIVTDSNASPLSSNGTVNVTMVQRVWYVNNLAAAGGTGRSTDPFDTLVEAQNAPTAAANDYIFVYFGNGGTTGQNAGIVLKAGQHLIGEYSGLSIPVSVNGGPNPTVLVMQPGATACSGGPCQPWIGNTVGDVVTNVTATQQIPAEIAGLDLNSATGNAIDVTSSGAITGSSLVIRNNYIRNALLESIDINRNAGSSGNLALAITDNAWGAVGGSYGGNAIDVFSAGGTGLTVNVTRNTNVKSNATAILINGGSTANTTVTGLFSNTIDPATGGTGLQITNARIDADAVAAGFQTVSGGTTVIGASGDGVGGAGLVLGTGAAAVIGDLAFTNLSVFSSGGAGIAVTSTGTFNAGAGTGMQLVATNPVDTTATGGPALDLNAVTINLTLNNISSTNSGTQGVQLTSVAGTLTVSGTTTVTNSLTQGVLISGSSVTATFGNTTITSGTDSVWLQNNATGTRTFGTLQTTGGTGVGFLHDNNGGVTNVTGAATFTNAGSVGISIQNSTTAVTFGNVSVNGSNNTGVFLSTNTAPVAFADLDIAPNSGFRALQATNNTALITTTSGTIAGTGGVATFEITGASAGSRTPLAMALDSITSTNATSVGVNINFTSGSLVVGTTTVTNATIIGIQVLNTVALSTQSFGTTSVQGGSNTAGVRSGATSNSNAGPVTFGSLNIGNTTPLTIGGAGLVALHNGAAGAALTVQSGGTIVTTDNSALDLNTVVVDLTLTSVSPTISSTANKGVSLTSVSGPIGIASGSITMSSTATGDGFLANSYGSTLTYGGTVTDTRTSGTGNAVFFNFVSGTATITGAVSAQQGSTGVRINGSSATVNFNGGLNLGNLTTLNTPNGGVTINSGSGIYNLGAVNIVTSNGPALSSVSEDGTINITSGSMATNSAGVRVIDIGGPAGLTTLNITLATLNRNPGAVTSNDGMVFEGTNGSIVAAAGTIKANNALSRVVEFNPAGGQATSGTYDFGGVTFNGAGSKGIALTSANTGTYKFGIFDAGSPAGGIGVSVASTSAAVTFRSVSQNGGSNGIKLTSATGSFDVNGDGTNTTQGGNSTGGTIQNLTGADNTTSGIGVYASTASKVRLHRMTIRDCQGYAVRMDSVTGFKFNYGTIVGVNGTTASGAVDALADGSSGEGSMLLRTLQGTAEILSSIIGGGYANIVRVVTESGTLDRLTIDNTLIGDPVGAEPGMSTVDGNNALHFTSVGAGTTANLTVTNSTFNNARANLVNTNSLGNGGTPSNLDVVVRGSTFTNTHTNQVIAGGGVTLQGLGNQTFDFSGNTLTFATSGANMIQGIALNIFDGHDPLATPIINTFAGQIIGNTVDGSNIAASGINVDAQGRGTDTILIQDNTVSNYGEAGIRVNTIDNNSTAATHNVVIVGNQTLSPQPTAFAGVHVVAGAAPATDSSQITNLQLGGSAPFQNDFSAGDPFNVADASMQNAAGTLNLSQGNSAAVTVPLVYAANNVPSSLTADPSVAVSNSSVVRLIASPTSVFEDGSTNITYTFLRWGNIQSALTVNFSVGGTAVFGTDYTQAGAASFNITTGSVTFAAGEPVVIVSINPSADLTIEANDTVTLSVTAGAGYTAATPSAATTTILDDDAAPLFAAAGGVTADQAVPAPALNANELGTLVTAAIDRLSATGLSASQLTALRGVKFEIADLADGRLAEAEGARVRIDRRAAGFGWFVDATPMDEVEFAVVATAGRHYANAGGLPASRMDLLTAILHELEHHAGLLDTYDERDRDYVNYGYLTTGERRLPQLGSKRQQR